MYKEALVIDKKVSGEEHPSVATSLNNLGILYKNQGKYDEAEKMYKEALAIHKKVSGEEHPLQQQVSTILVYCTKTKASTTRRKRCTRRHWRLIKRSMARSILMLQ